MMNKISDEAAAAFLLHAYNVDSKALQALKAHCKSYERALKAGKLDWLEAGLSSSQISAIQDYRKNIDTYLTVVEDLAIKIIVESDDAYPHMLKEIIDPPAILYVRGEVPDKLNISIVGSRKPSPYGESVAAKLSAGAAKMGLTVVSGLAYGIDTMAHEAALGAKGTTVAVLAGGVDCVYPAVNQNLAKRMIESGGGLLSEAPLQSKSLPYSFLVRNRIIAGLSPVTIVVEANTKSGALNTAKYVGDYNRELLVVPADIHRMSAKGSNRLLKSSGHVILGVEDIADRYGFKIDTKISHPDLSSDEKGLMKNIPSEGIHINKLAESLQLDIGQLSSKVIMLELKGVVRHEGAGVYRRII